VRTRGFPELLGETGLKRARFDTIYDILRLCEKTTKKTQIMFRINLSHAQLKKFISLSLETGLLSLTDEGYITTEKGKHFLVVFEELFRILPMETIRTYRPLASPSPLR